MSGGIGGIDIRLPIGLMFAIIGLIITVFGVYSAGDPIYRHSLGINVNLWWGLVLTGFGLLMLLLAWRAKGKAKD